MTDKLPLLSTLNVQPNSLLSAPIARPFTQNERQAPLTHNLNFYFGGSLHLQSFFSPFGFAAFKAGITGCADPLARIRDLRRQRFAGIWRDPKDPSDEGIILPQADEWFMVPVRQSDMRGKPVPHNIQFTNGYIALTVPARVTMTDVDRAVHQALKARSARDFLAQPDNQARLLATGYNPKAWFHTRYDLMTETDRISAVQELYVIRPRVDLPEVVAMLSDLIAGFHPLQE